MSRNPDTWLIPTLIAGFMGVSAWLIHFPHPNLITFDVYGYYVYLPAAITFHDLGHFGFVDAHFDSYDLLSGPYQVVETGTHRIPIYTMGLALLVAPFYILADLVALAGGLPRDGLSPVYQVMFWLSSVAWCWIGFHFMVRWLGKYLDRGVLWVTLLSIALGTNYLIYAAHELGLTHAYVFSLYAILFYLSDRWAERGKLKWALWIAVVISLLCLVRPTELISVVIPLGYGILKVGARTFFRERWKQLIAMGATGVVFILPQVILWKLNTGHWIFNAYMAQGHQFDFFQPHLFDGLFSYRKGWLVYTPLMVLALTGLFQLYHRQRPWFWPVLVYLLLHTWITFSWGMWWYASSFGSRPMVHAYAALALPLGLFFIRFRKNPVLWVIAGICMLLNLVQSYQYIRKILPGDGINRVFYWKSFGKLTREPAMIKYVDLDRALLGLDRYDRIPLGLVEHANAELDSASEFIIEKQGLVSEMLPPGREFGEALVHTFEAGDLGIAGEEQWLFVEAELFREGDAFNAWDIAQLGISFHADGQVVLSDGIRFPFHLGEGEWGTTGFEIPVPKEVEPGDFVKVYIWNPSPDTIYIHRLSLFRLEKKK